MGKLFKVLGIIIVLLVVALVSLPLLIDPNDYKQEIVEQVEKQTGRQLALTGDLSLTVFPWIGIETGALSLSNAEGFGDAPFAAVNSAAVRVKLMPLLSSKLEADTIVLDGLNLNLARNKQGVSNWDDLTGGKGGKPAGEKTDAGEPGASSQGLAGLSIGGVQIQNAQISWNDQSTGQQAQISDLNLVTDAIQPGKPVDVEFRMQLKNNQPQVDASVEMSGRIAIDGNELSIAQLVARLSALGEATSNQQLDAELKGDLSYMLDGQSMALQGLQLTIGELHASGSLQGVNLNTLAVFNGEFNIDPFNPRKLMGSLGIEPPQTTDPRALTQVSANLKLVGSNGKTTIDQLTLKLDESTLTGNAKFKGKATAFALQLDRIDLDRYLPPAAEQPATEQAAAGGAKGNGKEAELLPVELLRSLELDGTLDIGWLKVNKLIAEQVKLGIEAHGGKILVEKKIGRFYDGKFDALTNINVQGKSPVMNVDSKLDALQIGPLLKDMTGQDKLIGTGKAAAKLRVTGNSVSAFKRSLNGNLNFRFDNGAVKGVNLAQLIRDAKAKLKGQAAGPAGPSQTDFSEMSGSARITNGVLNNQDLLAKSPFLRVTGKGTVNLPAETLDYTATTTIVSTAKGQGGEGLDELKGIPIPVHLTGSLAAPDYKIDWGKVLAGSQKAKIEEKKTELKNKLQDKLKGKLKGLF